MLTLAAPPAKFVTFHADAFKLSQLQRSLDLKWVRFNIEPLYEIQLSTLAPEFEDWDYNTLCFTSWGPAWNHWTGLVVFMTSNLTVVPLDLSYRARQGFSSESFEIQLLQLFLGFLAWKTKRRKVPVCSCCLFICEAVVFLDGFFWFSLAASLTTSCGVWGFSSPACLCLSDIECLEPSLALQLGPSSVGRLRLAGRSRDGF